MLLTWKQLDACTTSSEIAALLLKNNIRGVPGSLKFCPLARATGSKVGITLRYDRDGNPGANLTSAERAFISEFDDGEWSELSIDAEQSTDDF